jgi:hypothetical protein
MGDDATNVRFFPTNQTKTKRQRLEILQLSNEQYERNGMNNAIFMEKLRAAYAKEDPREQTGALVELYAEAGMAPCMIDVLRDLGELPKLKHAMKRVNAKWEVYQVA